MNDDQFGLQPSPLRDLSSRPLREGFELDAGVQGTQAAVKAEGAVDVGKGWSVGGAVSWVKGAGAAAWGKVVWTPKPK